MARAAHWRWEGEANMDDAVQQITPDPLTPEAWAPYGWLPVPDTDPADGAERLAFDWDDVHVNIISHRRDEVPEVAGGLRCVVLFRHDTHTQVLMSLDATCVVVVAPAAVLPDSVLHQVRAFVLPPLTSVVLHRGTWHWGPYPVTAEAVNLFNVQGLGYREDNRSVDLAAVGAAREVRHDRGAAQSRGSAVGRHPDLVALGVGEDPEAGPGHLLDRLGDGPAQVLGFLQGGGDVFDAHEEQDFVLAALARADGDVGRTFDPSVDEGVTGEGSL
jgi:ureidoglycolate hydrolase